jgi:thioredoxin reductase (NADPH)
VAPLQTDALVIGAGPVGLFQVFQLGLQDMRAHVVDVLPHAGGQCTELYGDKPIYDIPALPFSTGQELVDRLLQQTAPFKPHFHLGHEVSELQQITPGADADSTAPRFRVATRQGLQIECRSIFVAAGVGAFQPRRLKLAGIERFEGGQLLYRVPEATHFAGQQLVVNGQDDGALATALHFAQADVQQRPTSVTLLHRRDDFGAAPDTVARLRAGVAQRSLRLVIGQCTAFEEAQGRLKALQIATPNGGSNRLAVDQLLVLQGLSPQLGPIAHWGLALERKQLVVDTECFQTSVPGIYAVGDINTYPGKRKLIVCGFHEATLAAYAAAAQLHTERPQVQQYTTSSTHLQRLLGVAPSAGASRR